MQTPAQNTAPFFSSSFFGGSNSSSNNNHGSNDNNNSSTNNHNTTNSSQSRSRPGTSSGDYPHQSATVSSSTTVPSESKHNNVLHKDRDRRPSFSLGRPFGGSPSKKKSRANSSSSANGSASRPQIVTDNTAPPALPDFALAAAAKLSRDADPLQSPSSADSFSKMLSRTAPTPINGYSPQLAPPAPVGSGPHSETFLVHQNIQEIANKRISTLDYLRKSHEGRVYWFNTLLFDKPDLVRMPYFDSRKLARRATNYLLLGLSLPAVMDLNSSTPIEFLRSLNTLLTEFDAFQSLHSEHGSSSSSLSRARLPQMFRRATPGPRGRRTSGAGVGFPGSASGGSDVGYPLEQSDSNGGSGGGGGPGGLNGGAGPASSGAGAVNFAASETDLLPGEEYTHLLTPSLPFEPDFFETFATLCDMLIDCYTRLLSLIPTPRDCTNAVAELFTKTDSRVRKIIIQGAVKEFEDTSRSGVKVEVANVGKVVLGGLM